jgi:curved DNA-binding protein CbpA
MKPFGEQTFYELLDLPVTATTAEIQAAYGQAALLYGPDSVALYTLVEPEQADAFRGRLHDALATLSDPEHRAAYNRALGLVEALAETPAANPENLATEPAPSSEQAPRPLESVAEPPAPGEEARSEPIRLTPVIELPAVEASVPPPLPPPVPAPVEAAPPRPPDPKPRPLEVGPDSEFSGELLRRLREDRGMTLQNLADRTRISRSHLENVEADRYAHLPPTVYLRGFLTSIARELKVDPQWVCRSYLALVAAAGPAKR